MSNPAVSVAISVTVIEKNLSLGYVEVKNILGDFKTFLVAM